MLFTIIAPGSRGDVQPYVALGKGLQAAGHVVRLVTHEDFGALARAHGLEFWPMAGNVQEIAQSAAMRERLGSGSFLRVLRQMAKDAQAAALAAAEVGLAACQGADLLLAGLGGLFVALALAEKLGLPLVQAFYIPLTPTRAYPSFFLAGLPAGPNGALNRLSYHLARQSIWQAFRPADRLMRQKALGLPGAPLLGPFDAPCTRQTPILYGYSPAVIPPPPDWDARTHVTGYWFLDEDQDWEPPAALEAFLRAGPPPVYVGFGSMSSRDPRATAELVLRALEAAGQRAVLLGGWGGLSAADWPETVYLLDSAPFGWLFPRMAAVVHHGGAGTMSAGLRAGVPSVVIPFFGDQPYWGRRVAELGVGPTPIPRKKLTAERLAGAIRAAVSDEEMRRRAAELGATIRAEDGVARAVEVIQGMAERGDRP